MVCTGVMKSWTAVANASFQEAPILLNQAAMGLLNLRSILLLLLATTLIISVAYLMNQRAKNNTSFSSTWLVASAALTTTIWVDGLFFLTTLIQPQLSGLI